MNHRILLIEDDPQISTMIQGELAREGYEVSAAQTGKAGLDLTQTNIFDLALIDIHLPDMTGTHVLEELKRRDPGIDAVMITGYPQVETAVQALRLGAYDYLIKPFDWVALRHLLKRLFEHRYLRAEVSSLRDRLQEHPPEGELIGASQRMQQLRETIAKVAPTDSVILIEGESGTGKELIASAIHRHSARSAGPFIPVNCAAIPADLVESELFGHVKGAFSGAHAESRGLFRAAERGTIFLDEVGDLPVPLQPKLLRVLQAKEVRPVGSSQVHRVDARVIAATNQNLEAAVKSGKFREDLFFRLNVVRIEAAPLREVREDIPRLAMHFVRALNQRFGRRVQSIAPEALEALRCYDFPGNVRELENLLERAYALGAAGQITLADLPSLSVTAPASKPAAGALNSLESGERQLILGTLRACGDDRGAAARSLGISERTLYRRLKRLGL